MPTIAGFQKLELVPRCLLIDAVNLMPCTELPAFAANVYRD